MDVIVVIIEGHTIAIALMEFDEDQNSASGVVPEFGAIFMSNSTTKRECFRWELFGLPASQANFVKQVKSGMLLFLFEYESRKLYGVFQACSDGATNIVLHAYKSSGKQFPAQVRFSTLWDCNPLSEYEFRNAIEENYFSANKFNFGLSEDQVRRLLLLFSSRKLKEQLPHSLFTRRKFKKQIGESFPTERKLADGGRLTSDHVDFQKNSTKYFRNYLGQARKKTGDGSFCMIKQLKKEHILDNNLDTVISSKHITNSYGESNVANDDRFMRSDGRENESKMVNSLSQVLFTQDSDFESNPHHSSYCKNPISSTKNMLGEHYKPASAVPHAMGPQYCHSFSTQPDYPEISSIYNRGSALLRDNHKPNSARDSNMSISKYCDDGLRQVQECDSTWASDISDLNPYQDRVGTICNHPDCRRSSSYFDYSLNSIHECPPAYITFGNNKIPLHQDSSLPYHVKQNGTTRCMDVNCGIGDRIPEPLTGRYKCSGYSGDWGIASSRSEICEGSSFSEPSASLPFLTAATFGRKNAGHFPSVYSYCKPSSFVSDSDHTSASLDKIKRMWHESDGFISDMFSQTTNFHEKDSISQNVEYCQSGEGMHSNCQDNKTSVFSRLTSVRGVQETCNHVNYSSLSVDDVMRLLQQSQQHCLKNKKSKQGMRRLNIDNDDDKKSKDIRKNSLDRLIEGDTIAITTGEMNIKSVLASEEDGKQVALGYPIVNFRRRSELRRFRNETKPEDSIHITECRGKRRKLLRPDFGTNELSNESKGIGTDHSGSLQLSSQDISEYKGN